MKHLTITRSITNREDIALDKYLAEIAKENMVTMEEEVTLAREIKKGSQEALDRLVRSNLRFVVSVAKQYQNNGMTLTDLINEGNLGLIKAAKRFDETRGFKFISYAVWWIRQSMIQAMAENGRIVRLPLNRHTMIRKIKSASADLEQQLERSPTAEEISIHTSVSVTDIEDAWTISSSMLSMDVPMPSGEGGTFSDMISNNDLAPDERLLSESLATDIGRILSLLTQREADILKRYYGIGLRSSQTLDEIGGQLNLTRERVRQLKEKALVRLRHSLPRRVLQNYMG